MWATLIAALSCRLSYAGALAREGLAPRAGAHQVMQAGRYSGDWRGNDVRRINTVIPPALVWGQRASPNLRRVSAFHAAACGVREGLVSGYAATRGRFIPSPPSGCLSREGDRPGARWRKRKTPEPMRPGVHVVARTKRDAIGCMP